MSEEEGTQVLLPPRPTESGPEAWKHYWAAVQPEEWLKAWGYWRTEPEIDAKRQGELAHQYRSNGPNIEKSIYPFKGVKLTRADIEWLLATHDARRGPVDWSNPAQRERKGLDLRGADLSGANLTDLPLARMRGGLILEEWDKATTEQRSMAEVHLEGAT